MNKINFSSIVGRAIKAKSSETVAEPKELAVSFLPHVSGGSIMQPKGGFMSFGESGNFTSFASQAA